MSTTRSGKSRVPISEQAIRARVDVGSYERGERYFRKGAIFDGRRQGQTVKARCEGSQGGPYHVWATINDKGKIVDADCSCPVGGGGACKHVVALLLTYRARPGDFPEVEDVEASLERRSKPELIALIKQMIRREPDLERLLEIPLPGAPRSTPTSPDLYRRQALAALREYDPGEYRSAVEVGGDLEPIVEIGDGFLKNGDYEGASAVYEGVGGAVFEAYSTIDDESGEVGQIAGRCLEGLAECFPHLAADNPRRAATLRALFDGFGISSEYDFDDVDIPALLAQHATPEERQTVARWARDYLEGIRGKPYKEYERRAYTRFLTELEKDALGTDDLIRIYREEALVPELVDQLLEVGRFDEAEAELAAAPDHEVLHLADLFVSHRRSEAAERIVRERAKKAPAHDTRFLAWLKRRAADRKDRAAVRELTEALFRQSPSSAGYKELRGLVRKADEWNALRPKLLEALAKSSRSELIRVHLDEGDIDQAIELVQREQKSRSASPYGYGLGIYGSGMELEVAKAAEKDRPAAAIEIYKKYAELLIDARGRDNYETACQYLKKVKALYERIGDRDRWEYYAGVLRERYSSLSAFKDEMKKARL
jgi:hypothetical protein